MPELPEVEVVARSLRPCVVGRRVACFEVHDKARLRIERAQRMLGRLVHNVRRIGKQVVFELDSDEQKGKEVPRRLWLAVHLRMTGRLLAMPGRPAGSTKHLRALWRFDDNSYLAFIDARRFGTIVLYDSRKELTPAGLDPMSRGFTVERLGELVAASRGAPLKTWLLRQDRLVGLGNIYASEILFAAKLHPERRTAGLAAEEIKRLHAATREVLKQAIRDCGTTFSDFQNSRGEIGSFQDCLNVYGRAGKPCPVCGTPIDKQAHAGRSTFWCPRCQPKPATSERS